MKENTKKIAFLFGAGAEGAFDLPLGGTFLEKTIYNIEDKDEILEALHDKFNPKYCYFSLLGSEYKYSEHTLNCEKEILKKSVKMLISTGELNYTKYNKEINYIFSKKDFDKLDSSQNLNINLNKDIKKEEKDKNIKVIYVEFNKALKKQIKYSELNSKILKVVFEHNKKDECVLRGEYFYGGFFDNKFHTIINPSKYGSGNFSKVFNYYWFCYFCIVRGIVDFYSKYSDIFQEYKNGNKLDYKKILDNIIEFTNLIYSQNISNDKSYYSIINNKISNEFKNKLKLVGISTTNYFNFCNIVSLNVTHLNGRLNWFEFPEKLEVKDLLEKTKDKSDFNGSKLFFPFIFGQSYVKPIVSQKQIAEFNNFSELLTNTDSLIVLGYNLNEDDNHINAYLHDFVKRGKQLIVVGDEKSDENDVKKKIRINGGDDKCVINYCPVDYEKHSIEEIVNSFFSML